MPALHLPMIIYRLSMQTAWRINGKWNYDDCLDIQKAISYKQLKPMIQDRFIDHDKCGDRLKKLVLPLQQVGRCHAYVGVAR